MKISKEHIENLYQFTRQHYVVHYDLQTELVDHLANDIEAVWEENPNLSFNKARDLSFKKFGVFGFMDVVSERQKIMNKRYMKILWSFAKEWFTLPELIKTVALLLLFYSLFNLNQGRYIAIIAFVSVFSLTFIKGFKYLKYIKKKEKPGEKFWLLEDLIFRNASVNALVFLSLIVNGYNVIDSFWDISYSPIIAAIILTLLSIYSYVSVIILPNQSEKLLKKTYPEYSL